MNNYKANQWVEFTNELNEVEIANIVDDPEPDEPNIIWLEHQKTERIFSIHTDKIIRIVKEPYHVYGNDLDQLDAI